jgi:hypothetical protein
MRKLGLHDAADGHPRVLAVLSKGGTSCSTSPRHLGGAHDE